MTAPYMWIFIELGIILAVHLGATYIYKKGKIISKEVIPVWNIFFGITGMMTWHPLVNSSNWIIYMFHGIVLGLAATGLHFTIECIKRHIAYEKFIKANKNKITKIDKTLEEGGEK